MPQNHFTENPKTPENFQNPKDLTQNQQKLIKPPYFSHNLLQEEDNKNFNPKIFYANSQSKGQITVQITFQMKKKLLHRKKCFL